MLCNKGSIDINNVATQKGFSLVELVVVIALAGILLALATPAFQSLIDRNQLTAKAEAMLTALALARSEAIRRASRITLCKSSDGTSCIANGGYHQGWLIFADTDNNAVRSGSEEIIQVQTSWANELTATGSGAAAATYLSYTADGTSRPAPSGLPAPTQISISNGNEIALICVDAIGRAHLETTSC